MSIIDWLASRIEPALTSMPFNIYLQVETHFFCRVFVAKRVLPSLTAFHLDLPSFTGFYRVLPHVTGFYLVFLGVT